MAIVTSREFNQNSSLVQRKAEKEHVIITKRGKPNLVILSFEEYQAINKKPQTIWEVITGCDVDVELPEFDRKSFKFREPDISEWE